MFILNFKLFVRDYFYIFFVFIKIVKLFKICYFNVVFLIDNI